MVKNGTKITSLLQSQAIDALKKASFHLNSIIEMTEKDKSCVEVLREGILIQDALKKADYLLLENHLKTCLEELKKEKNQNNCFKEIIKIFRINSSI